MIFRQRYYDILSFISVLTLRKFWNFLLLMGSYGLSVLFRRDLHRGWPMAASIEPTTRCNLRCPECPAGLEELSRPGGEVDLEDYYEFFDGLEENLLYLTLYFQGEPFLQKNIFELISIARKKRIYVATSTNGHFLNETNCQRIIDSGLNRLIISFDGTDDSTYQTYRKGGSFDKVKEGVTRMVAARNALKAKHPRIILQFIVFRHNEQQVEEVKVLGRLLGADEVQIKTAQLCNFQDGHPMMTRLDKYSRYRRIGTNDGRPVFALKKKIRNRCFRMWSSCVITWDGRLLPCCFDKDATNEMGNLLRESLNEIWKGDRMKLFRQQILNDRKQKEMCCNCSE